MLFNSTDSTCDLPDCAIVAGCDGSETAVLNIRQGRKFSCRVAGRGFVALAWGDEGKKWKEAKVGAVRWLLTLRTKDHRAVKRP